MVGHPAKREARHGRSSGEARSRTGRPALPRQRELMALARHLARGDLAVAASEHPLVLKNSLVLLMVSRFVAIGPRLVFEVGPTTG
jgi:hypothetical protein